MSTACLERNAIVKVQGIEHRLFRKIDSRWQLEEMKTGNIVTHEHRDLLRMIADNTLTFPGSVPINRCGPVNCDLSTDDFELAKLRRSYVTAVLHTPNSRARLKAVINDVWTRLKAPETAPGHISVYQWKARFLKSNGDIRSLVNDTRSKGRRQSRYPREVVEMCQQSISSRYMQRERNSIQQTFEDALLRVTRENALRPAGDPLPPPTRRLIRRLIAQIPAFDKEVAREGRDAATKKYRSVKGHMSTLAPLERAEIDHTVLDVMVVDAETRLPLGRPYVTACIDCYTRCILGIYIGFNPPSYQSVAACLKHCFQPKVNLKQEYPSIVNEWPAYGVMQNLVVDGGREFYSESLEQVCLALNINWVAAPRRTPWFKGTIERLFGTMNRAVIHGLPGTTFSDIFEKGDYDPSKQATISLSALKQIINKWIVDVYHQQDHRSLQASPAKMWTSSINPEDIRLPDESTQLDAIMGRVYNDRRLSHKGIEFEGLLYNSADLTALRIKEGANLKVDIRVDESNLGSITAIYRKTSTAFSVPALSFEYANGVSLWLHKVLKNRQSKTDQPDQSPHGWLESKAEIQEVIARELRLKRSTPSKRRGRLTEAIEGVSAKAGTRKLTPIRPDVSAHLFPQGFAAATEPSQADELEQHVPVVVQRTNSGRRVFKAVLRKGV
jgi:putative transposase